MLLSTFNLLTANRDVVVAVAVAVGVVVVEVVADGGALPVNDWFDFDFDSMKISMCRKSQKLLMKKRILIDFSQDVVSFVTSTQFKV